MKQILIIGACLLFVVVPVSLFISFFFGPPQIESKENREKYFDLGYGNYAQEFHLSSGAQCVAILHVSAVVAVSCDWSQSK